MQGFARWCKQHLEVAFMKFLGLPGERVMRVEALSLDIALSSLKSCKAKLEMLPNHSCNAGSSVNRTRR